MKNFNKKFTLLPLAVALLLLCSCDLLKKTPQDKIRQRINDISELRTRLENKSKKIDNLRQDYKNGIRELQEEILLEKKKNNIMSFQAATKNQTIAFDLSLINTKTAYIQKIDEIQKQLLDGSKELLYVQRKAQDDLKILEVLDDKEKEELAESINKVITHYLPDAGELVVEVDESALQPMEAVWSEIMKIEKDRIEEERRREEARKLEEELNKIEEQKKEEEELAEEIKREIEKTLAEKVSPVTQVTAEEVRKELEKLKEAETKKQPTLDEIIKAWEKMESKKGTPKKPEKAEKSEPYYDPKPLPKLSPRELLGKKETEFHDFNEKLHSKISHLKSLHGSYLSQTNKTYCRILDHYKIGLIAKHHERYGRIGLPSFKKEMKNEYVKNMLLSIQKSLSMEKRLAYLAQETFRAIVELHDFSKGFNWFRKGDQSILQFVYDVEKKLEEYKKEAEIPSMTLDKNDMIPLKEIWKGIDRSLYKFGVNDVGKKRILFFFRDERLHYIACFKGPVSNKNP